ncbi:phosphomannomutase [Georgenia satyanarayanai]|uniref:Phosphomannomutase n=1 Tax=Georgenia satyanarayanai TaxID=860221 RepID=A0A2Y9AE08_9MICO|nr:phospho-sugar mutase [Georgenia satyanarayanai]PYG00241.1 phosphomannomutase [Georgenia satyanarayanai]SSA40557.1 phosphomannomutase [Georgenia satyanarayanai]
MDVDVVRSWITQDPDPQTANELGVLLERATAGGPEAHEARAELEDRFSGPLAFGTAGLRGALGGGPNRMNRAVVIRTTAGLAAWLTEQLGGAAPRVVIGYDARHGSARFAEDAAAVITGAGGRAMLMPSVGPTPVLAYAVRALEADAGVMVTASHNPKEDNGYKVYLGGRVVTDSGQGAQLVSPADAEIAARIDAVGALTDVPLPVDGWQVLDASITEEYIARVASLVPHGYARSLRIVYTPMHGVGAEVAVAALAAAGFTDVHVVAEQAEPDPEFPTVAFPNPEEPGALDLAFRLAQQVEADLVIANDPDADRCSVAVPAPGTVEGWRQLTGDEVGALLGKQSAISAAVSGHGVLASSVVSSRLLARIATSHGLEHRTTLTGFKWISRVPGLVFGYEEALGYCVDPQAVRDKDGISAAVRVALLASQLVDRGSTLLDVLDELALQHGLHATAPLTLRVSDVSVIGPAMQRLRESGPQSLAGSPVVRTIDLSAGEDGLPPTDGLVYLTARGDRAIIRPSGTEPKLKCYLEAVEPVSEQDRLPAARRAAAERLDQMKAELGALIGL